jgi:hypothetical protein
MVYIFPICVMKINLPELCFDFSNVYPFDCGHCQHEYHVAGEMPSNYGKSVVDSYLDKLVSKEQH